MDGLRLTHQLKSTSETRHIPVLISMNDEISESEEKSLNESLEEITLKSEQHTIDVFHYIGNWLEIQKLARSTIVKISDSNAGTEKLINAVNQTEPLNTQPIDLTVLIVDDDSNTLFTLSEIVRTSNCNPILAHNGKECLEVLESKIPDLILLDIIMPEMDGFKTIKQIKANSKWADIPVVAVTAKAMKEDKEIIIRHGFTDYIPKPVNPAFVSHKIQTLITQLKIT
jgi:CheY-like chemotaxis protein